MYIHHPVSTFAQPVELLRGFQRVHLEPAQTRTVTFKVGTDQLAILDAKMQEVVETGRVDILIGANSSDTEQVEIGVME